MYTEGGKAHKRRMWCVQREGWPTNGDCGVYRGREGPQMRVVVCELGGVAHKRGFWCVQRQGWPTNGGCGV